MNPKIYLARIASVAERIFDAVRPKREYGDIEIDACIKFDLVKTARALN